MIQNHLYLDVLALVRRGGESLLNEPHAGGGSPVLASSGTAYFSDVHGTTLGAKQGRKYSAAAMTAFGDGDAAYFTGKPLVAGLGRAFLLRNYRADLAKWQTADPLGYPDGWNLFTYGPNAPNGGIDLYGAYWVEQYASCWIEKECTDLVFIYNGESPMNITLPRTIPGGVFSAICALIKMAKKAYADKHPDMKKFIDAYIFSADKEVGSNPITPTEDECLAAIDRIMKPLGYDWEYIDKSAFAMEYIASDCGSVIKVDSMSVLWKISYKYWMWVEE